MAFVLMEVTLGQKGFWVLILVFSVALSQTGKLVCTLVFQNEKDSVSLANISTPEHKETQTEGPFIVNVLFPLLADSSPLVSLEGGRLM